MLHAALGDPSRPAHQEILKEEKTWLDHVDDVLPRCRHIVEIVQTCIDISIFPDRSDVRYILDSIMTEARGALIYRRQGRRTGGLMAEETEDVEDKGVHVLGKPIKVSWVG